MRRRALVLAVALGACGRGGVLAGGVFTRDRVAYRVVEPPAPGWRRAAFADNDLAWVSPGTGHVIAMNATCVGHEDPPLEVLTTHLLIGFTDRELVDRRRLELDGRGALRSTFRARLDGVPRQLDLVVLKKNGCVHDLTLVSPVGREAEHQALFEAMVAGFRQERAP